MTRLQTPAICSSISRHEQKGTGPASKTALSLQQSADVPSLPGWGWAEDEIRRVKVNLIFENFEGQDDVSSETSAFQREGVELAMPFLIWHLTKASN